MTEVGAGCDSPTRPDQREALRAIAVPAPTPLGDNGPAGAGGFVPVQVLGVGGTGVLSGVAAAAADLDRALAWLVRGVASLVCAMASLAIAVASLATSTAIHVDAITMLANAVARLPDAVA